MNSNSKGYTDTWKDLENEDIDIEEIGDDYLDEEVRIVHTKDAKYERYERYERYEGYERYEKYNERRILMIQKIQKIPMICNTKIPMM